MNKQIKDRTYLEIAKLWSTNSKAIRKKVGAIIVKNKMIISDGYNGTVSGFDNVCEDKKGRTKKEVLHAEANAILKLAKNGISSKDATLYITMSPCFECAKLIIQSGIKRVVYTEEYRIKSGLTLLKKANIIINRYE